MQSAAAALENPARRKLAVPDWRSWRPVQEGAQSRAGSWSLPSFWTRQREFCYFCDPKV